MNVARQYSAAEAITRGQRRLPNVLKLSHSPDLYRQQKDFERSRKYLEADLLKKQISSLRLKQGRFVKQSLRDRQQEQVAYGSLSVKQSKRYTKANS